MKLYLGLFIFIFILGITNAWTQETSVYIAKQVLIEKYPACALQIEQGVKEVYQTEPIDPFLREPLNFHCDTMQCLAFSPLYCNTQVKTCPSENKAGSVKMDAQILCNCEQAKELAKAVTYFAAKYNPMNVMVNESVSCRNGFTGMIENNMKENEWNIEYQCDAPNMIFTFNKKKFDEIITNTKGFAFANAFSGTNQWYCYTFGDEGEGKENETYQLKENGELCVSNIECESDYCNNRVCCESGTCCPNPEVKGHPCLQGQLCNENYMCEYLQYSNGEKCEHGEECSSGNCAYNMLNNQAYCTTPEEMYGCVNDDDCLNYYECVEYSCKYIPKEDDGNDNDNENENNKINGNGICLILPLILLSGLCLFGRNRISLF